jgi:hypothetical protein
MCSPTVVVAHVSAAAAVSSFEKRNERDVKGLRITRE